MDIFGDKFEDLRLKCDFPARESFREELLERLKVVIAQPEQVGGDYVVEPDEQLDASELSDDDLQMIAAAGEQSLTQGVFLPKSLR